MSPQVDHVRSGVVAVARRQRLDCRREGRLLRLDQRCPVATGPLQQSELHEELDTKVTNVGDGGGKPHVEGPLARRRDLAHRSERRAVTGFGVQPVGESSVGQTIEGSVHQRSVDGEDPTEIRFGGEFSGDAEPVTRLFGKQCQNDPFVQREFDAVHDHDDTRSLVSLRLERGYLGPMARAERRARRSIDAPAERWTTSRPILAATLVVALCGAVVVAGCGSNDQTQSRRPLLIFAAASFATALGDAEVAFEARHPDADVQLNLAGSASLRVQILEGSPADVFVSANEEIMDQVVDAGAAADAVVVARNRMTIAVPVGNPAAVRGLGDFADDDLLIGLCAQGVPCGDFARQVLANAGITPSLDTNEADVRSLVTRIGADELDAGIVYASDVAATDDVEGIEIPADVNVETRAPIAVLSDAPNPTSAAAFVEFLLSAEGRTILIDNGFVP